MQFLSHYGLFLAQTLTIVFALLLTLTGILVLIRQGKHLEKEKLEVKNLNTKYNHYADTLNAEILEKSEFKKLLKKEKKEVKKNEKQDRKRIFVLEFDGDIRASAVNSLREEVTAILKVAKETDEVVVCLDSPGGMVSPYGLAASELQRLKRKKIPLTVAIDKMAASGGYLMACVADKILAAPFAIIGSIGVVVQLPNFHRLLKSKDVDFELLTAGEYKRTLTMFGENTPKAREKMQEDIEEIHYLFKDFISQNRPQVNIEEVATGEHWLASRALNFKLIDELTTSDDYLLNASQTADIYQIHYTVKKSLGEKLGSVFGSLFQGRMI
jgi:serine protease SohB